MENESPVKLKKLLELPKINPQIIPTSRFPSQEKRVIKISDPAHPISYQKPLNETTKNSKIDSLAANATLYYFRHQVPNQLKKQNSLNDGGIFMKNFSFSNVKNEKRSAQSSGKE